MAKEWPKGVKVTISAKKGPKTTQNRYVPSPTVRTKIVGDKILWEKTLWEIFDLKFFWGNSNFQGK